MGNIKESIKGRQAWVHLRFQHLNWHEVRERKEISVFANVSISVCPLSPHQSVISASVINMW